MKPPKLREKDIAKSCEDFMVLDGWRVVITDPPRLRGLGVTEPGICDSLFIRYHDRSEAISHWEIADSQTIWIEWKSKSGVAGEKQKSWQRTERARGALVWNARTVGEEPEPNNFEASIEGFQEKYRASGLMRRNLR